MTMAAEPEAPDFIPNPPSAPAAAAPAAPVAATAAPDFIPNAAPASQAAPAPTVAPAAAAPNFIPNPPSNPPPQSPPSSPPAPVAATAPPDFIPNTPPPALQPHLLGPTVAGTPLGTYTQTGVEPDAQLHKNLDTLQAAPNQPNPYDALQQPREYQTYQQTQADTQGRLANMQADWQSRIGQHKAETAASDPAVQTALPIIRKYINKTSSPASFQRLQDLEQADEAWSNRVGLMGTEGGVAPRDVQAHDQKFQSTIDAAKKARADLLNYVDTSATAEMQGMGASFQEAEAVRKAIVQGKEGTRAAQQSVVTGKLLSHVAANPESWEQNRAPITRAYSDSAAPVMDDIDHGITVLEGMEKDLPDLKGPLADIARFRAAHRDLDSGDMQAIHQDRDANGNVTGFLGSRPYLKGIVDAPDGKTALANIGRTNDYLKLLGTKVSGVLAQVAAAKNDPQWSRDVTQQSQNIIEDYSKHSAWWQRAQDNASHAAVGDLAAMGNGPGGRNLEAMAQQHQRFYPGESAVESAAGGLLDPRLLAAGAVAGPLGGLAEEGAAGVVGKGAAKVIGGAVTGGTLNAGIEATHNPNATLGDIGRSLVTGAVGGAAGHGVGKFAGDVLGPTAAASIPGRIVTGAVHGTGFMAGQSAATAVAEGRLPTWEEAKNAVAMGVVSGVTGAVGPKAPANDPITAKYAEGLNVESQVGNARAFFARAFDPSLNQESREAYSRYGASILRQAVADHGEASVKGVYEQANKNAGSRVAQANSGQPLNINQPGAAAGEGAAGGGLNVRSGVVDRNLEETAVRIQKNHPDLDAKTVVALAREIHATSPAPDQARAAAAQNLRPVNDPPSTSSPEEAPKTAVQAAPPSSSASPAKPREVDLSRLPDYVREGIERSYSVAQKAGVVDRIEALAAQGKTAGEAAMELADKLPGTLADRREIVRSVRAKLGIPSRDNESDFQNWLNSRNAEVPAQSPPPAKSGANPGEPAKAPSGGAGEGKFDGGAVLNQLSEHFAAHTREDLQAMTPREVRDVAAGMGLKAGPKAKMVEAILDRQAAGEQGEGGAGKVHAMALGGGGGEGAGGEGRTGRESGEVMKQLGENAGTKETPNAPTSPAAEGASAERGGFLEQDVKPNAQKAVDGLRGGWKSVQRVVAPQTQSADARTGSEGFRDALGQLARNSKVAEEAIGGARAMFDKMPLAENHDFKDRMEAGEKQPTPQLQEVANRIRTLLDQKRREVQALGEGKLQKFDENYFPHAWKDKASGRTLNDMMIRTPLEGKKSFLKARTFETDKQGRELGYDPMFPNPVDAAVAKIGEMDRYIQMHKLVKEFKDNGLGKYRGVMAERDPARRAPTDPAFQVYGPPSVEIQEAFDKSVRDGLEGFAESIGVKHERAARIGGADRWGFSVEGGNRIATKFGGENSILAHEIGHQLDEKFGLSQFLYRHPDASAINRELVDLANARGLGSSKAEYTMSRPEEMATAVQAYVAAPELLQQKAPKTAAAFEQFLDKNPGAQGIRDIKPGLEMGVGTTEMAHGGLLKLGEYTVPNELADVIDNHVTPGLRGNALYRTYMGVNNRKNQLQLLGGYHGGFTSFTSMSSQAALSLEQLANGHPVRSLKSFAAIPGAPAADTYFGHTLMQEYYHPGTHPNLSPVMDALVKGGMRVGMDDAYHTRAVEGMTKAFRTGNLLGGVVRAPDAALDAVSRPIMNWLVPMQKLAASAKLMHEELEKLGPNATEQQIRQSAARVVDSMDNRFGQVAYDNLFMRRWVKDGLMGEMRSLGWNLGTVRELGGGVLSIPKNINSLARGKGFATHGLPFILGLLSVNAAGSALYQYLKTGQYPTSVKDFFLPKNGQKDANGQDVRVSLPTYARDVMALTAGGISHIGGNAATMAMNKAAPLLNDLYEVFWSNRDYYGTQIRDKDASAGTQLAQVGKHLATDTLPFSVSSLSKLGPNATLADKVAAQVGVSPAPKRFSNSAAENMLSDYIAQSGDTFTRTPEQQARDTLKKNIIGGMRSKDPGTRAAAVRGGENARDAGKLDERDLSEIMDHVNLSPLANGLKHSSLEPGKIMKVWGAMTPAERAETEDIVRQRINDNERLLPEEKEVLQNKIDTDMDRQGGSKP